ncbi:MAG: hypothetical protein K2G32_05700, partial [Oscillospiraceae bacterium]|nr:hypothetical protein [Oscillospiraceae bacterium]
MNSRDKIWEQYGQAFWYIEENETEVLVFEHFQGSDTYYTVFYGNDGDYDMVKINKDDKYSEPCRPQVTDDKIYLFTESSNTFLVTAIDRAARTSEFDTITYEDIGLPDKNLNVSSGNIFIDGSVIFLYADDYGSGGYVSMYDLESGTGASYKVKKDSGWGKLFRYGDGLGLTVSECYNSGYNTTMGIRFFEYDLNEPSIRENEDMYVEIAREAKYCYHSDGHKFYCIGDTLCGMIM